MGQTGSSITSHRAVDMDSRKQGPVHNLCMILLRRDPLRPNAAFGRKPLTWDPDVSLRAGELPGEGASPVQPVKAT